MSCTVLVGGGTGFIGNHLTKALKAKNYGVTVVSRMPGPQNVSWHDIAENGLPHRTTAVINLAGQNVMDITQRWSAGFKQNVYNSRVNTTAALAKAICEANVKPKVFVSMSGVGIYKPDSHTSYTESSPVTQFDFFSKLVLEWEKAANLAATCCRVATIRSGVVLGRNGGMIQQLYLPFYLGVGGPVGNGSQILPWIHIDDLVNLLIYCIENDGATGIFNGVAPNVCTNKEFSLAFGKAMNRPAFLPTPSFVFNLIFGAERAKMITEGQKVLPVKTEQIGFKFSYPDIQSACKQLVGKNT